MLVGIDIVQPLFLLQAGAPNQRRQVTRTTNALNYKPSFLLPAPHAGYVSNVYINERGRMWEQG